MAWDLVFVPGVLEFSIPTYVLVGVGLLLLGLVIGAFLSRRIGALLFVAGLAITFLWENLARWWANDINKITIIIFAIIVIVLTVLLAGWSKNGGKKK